MEIAVAIANYFVLKSLDSGTPFTPMQLLKLTYISHGWNLGLTEKPLIGEFVEAWKYGPVIPSVYRAFKEYGSSPVTKICEEDYYPIVDEQVKLLLDKIHSSYGRFSGTQLSSMTHKDGTPWQQTVKNYGENIPPHLLIPNKLIQNYYSHLAVGDGAA
jgi:uncharacterized phage-associated protein